MERLLSTLTCVGLALSLAACGSSGSGGTGRVGFAGSPPQVANLTPTSGKGNQSTTVTATGTGFMSVVSVSVGGQSVNFTINSDTSLSFVVPPGLPSGPQPVLLGFGALRIGGGSFTVLGADHVLMTEIGNGGGASNNFEFVELFNPTGAAISLANYYITDGTDQANNRFYYNLALPAPNNATAWSGLSSDFIVRFPPNATINPGQFLTVSMHDEQAGGTAAGGTPQGTVFFFDTYGRNPNFEVRNATTDDNDGIVDMINLRDSNGYAASSVGSGPGLSNDGEVLILFAWDGTSPLVQDVDYFPYGDAAQGTNEAVSKTGVSITNAAGTMTFRNETAKASQTPAQFLTGGSNTSINGAPATFQRIDNFEGIESVTNGNGITGHDETSENLTATFQEGRMLPSPGFDYPARPRALQTNAPRSSPVSFRFFRPVNNATTPSSTTFRVTRSGTAEAGTVSFDAPSNTVTFTPSGILLPLTTYTVTISANIQREDGLFFFTTDFTYTFTTGP